MLEVNKITGNKYRVIVKEKNNYSDHVVSIEPDYYQKLTDGKVSKNELLKQAFEFLLSREPAESILSKFDLKDINRFFPEFEEEIKKQLK